MPGLAEIEARFVTGMHAAGVPIDEPSLELTGRTVRFHVPGDKKGSKNGWYQAYTDGNPTICFGWWGKVDTQSFSLRDVASASPEDRAAYAKRIEEARLYRQKEAAKRQGQAAKIAATIWDKASPAPGDHPYLETKGIGSGSLRMGSWRKWGKDDSGEWLEHQFDGVLLVPIHNAKGDLRNLQAILPRKDLPGGRDKDFLSGGEKTGCFHLMGQPEAGRPLLVCEGYATGASLHECTGHAVAVAFDCGNLKAVAASLLEAWPGAQLLIAGDNDAGTEGNPGATKAREAAETAGVRWCVADFAEFGEAAGNATDFNDLHALAGADAVARQIAAALAAASPPVDSDGIQKLKPVESPAELKGEQKLDTVDRESGTSGETSGNSVTEGHGTRFELRSDGVYYIKAGYDRNDRYREDPPAKVCGYLEAVAMVRDRYGRGWCRLLALRDHDGKTRRMLLPDSTLEGEGREVTKPLRDAGLWVADNKSALLKMYINQSRPALRARLTARVGWHEDCDQPGLWSFVFPDDQVAPIAPQGAEPWLFEAKGSGHALFKARGTLEEWKQNVGILASGNSRLIVALCAGLASGVTWLHPNIPGGLHWAGGSSLGKSALLYAVASLCGAPEYRRTWMQTGTAVEWLAAGHSDCPLLLDELKQAGNPREVAQAAYMLASGAGKGRGAAAGGLRESVEFRALFQSNGEIGLDQFLREHNERSYAGQSVRFCELPGDAGKGLGCWDDVGDLLSQDEALHQGDKSAAGARFTDRVRAKAARYYGTAYPAWLRYVAEHRDDLADEFDEMLPQFERAYLSDAAGGQVRRVLVKFAAFALVGEKATDVGILPFAAGEVTKAVGRVFEEWVSAFGGETNQEPRRMVAQVREWIQRYAHTRLADMRRSWVDDTHTARPADCGGWKRPTKETATLSQSEHVFEYAIYPAVFNGELCKGFDPVQVARELRRVGLLECPPVGKDGKHRLQVNMREPGAKNTSRFFLIGPSILEGEEDVEA
ncbi:MAG: hypothetical protein RJA63_573 [Pseudomonadota bacterium]|jgi:putative DNA primase/helicase